MNDDDWLESALAVLVRVLLAALACAALVHTLRVEHRNDLQVARAGRIAAGRPLGRGSPETSPCLRFWHAIKTVGFLALCLVAYLCARIIAAYRAVFRPGAR